MRITISTEYKLSVISEWKWLNGQKSISFIDGSPRILLGGRESVAFPVEVGNIYMRDPKNPGLDYKIVRPRDLKSFVSDETYAKILELQQEVWK
ncbi:hypothetical protein H1O16_gp312 [Burkholderia phage BcepSaruman]|uniref:Uncharacterized protein n=1 Tax=Burkholderia phage BcepSaruman TaxID=2530032 RepID=A0A4D5ZCG0_9CAUD|nr:hypothetical protein H1O16_gp312 [Burkholderia phage BcepSaruman]QBX06725.1 hypothetical protein BcepSaruman_312 [Burkholderia phage BcepSaruman]